MAQTAGHCSDQKDLPWPTVRNAPGATNRILLRTYPCG